MKCVTVDSFDVRRRQDRLFASKAFALRLCLDIKAIYIDAASLMLMFLPRRLFICQCLQSHIDVEVDQMHLTCLSTFSLVCFKTKYQNIKKDIDLRNVI